MEHRSVFNGVAVRQPLDIGVRTSALHVTTGTSCDIAFSDWLNTYLLVTAYGEIRAGYLQDFISAFIDIHRRRKAIIGFTDVFDLGRPSINNDSNPPSISHDPDYAILFSDLRRVNYQQHDCVFFLNNVFFFCAARERAEHIKRYTCMAP